MKPTELTDDFDSLPEHLKAPLAVAVITGADVLVDKVTGSVIFLTEKGTAACKAIGAGPEADVDHVASKDMGNFLNRLRKEHGLTILGFSEQTGLAKLVSADESAAARAKLN